MPPHQPGYLQFLPLLIILPILYFRMRRMAKPQALKLNRMWIRPAILIAAASIVLLVPVPGAPRIAPADWLWVALAALLGAAAGWQWGRTTRLHLHPEDGTLMQTGSMAGMMVLVTLVVLRLGLRTGLRMEAGAWHLNVLMLTDISIVFSALLFAVRGLEIFLRARRVMAAGAG
jgi:hypothetical protein